MTYHSMQFGHSSENLLDRTPERLVVGGFRCWIAGYEFGDIDCWETAWNIYAELLGTQRARTVLPGLQVWVRTLRRVATRDACCFPHGCNDLSSDECMALSAISAGQRRDHSTLRASLHYLSGLNDGAGLDSLTDAAGSFSDALTAASQILAAITPDVAETVAVRPPACVTGRQTRH